MGEMRVRFLVNKASKRILYMEAGKPVVDLLLGFLQLPVATVLGIFTENAGSVLVQALKLGSVSNVYESLQKMSEESLVVSKQNILNPPCALKVSKKSPHILLPAAPATLADQPRTVYRCSSCKSMDYVSWVSDAICPSCGRCRMTEAVTTTGSKVPHTCDHSPFNFSEPSWSSPMFSSAFPGEPNHSNKTFGNPFGSSPFTAVPPSRTKAAKAVPTKAAKASPTEEAPIDYIKDHLSFIVTDDLCILPTSTIESIVLLNKLNVKNMSDLDSLECSLTADEALELLRVSLTSTEVLNDVFHAKVASSSFGKGPI